MGISHIGIPVYNSDRLWAFYTRTLAPLGIEVSMIIGPGETQSGGTAIGFGTPEQPGFFWFGDNEVVGEGIHVAFDAATRDAVHEFYDAALKAGGADNGPPGLRPHYGPNYYAAFVLDPDGHNIEAVCLAPE